MARCSIRIKADARAYLGMFRILGIPWGLEELERHYSPDWHQVYRAAAVPQERWNEADRLWRSCYRDERQSCNTAQVAWSTRWRGAIAWP